MTKKIALINMKGGVGKSTLAVNLAWELATYPWNKSVLLIDLDPQFNASQYTVGADRVQRILENGEPTVWDLFEQFTVVPGRSPQSFDIDDAIFNVYGGNRRSGSIDLLPSRLELSQSLRNPSEKERLLKNAVGPIEQRYDVILIDCAPTESVLTTAAYHVADWILVPVRPEYLSTIGLPLLVNSIDEFKARNPGEEPELLGIVFNAISNYAPEEVTSRQEVSQLAVRHNWYVFRNEVPYSKSFPKGAREGRPIMWTSYARTSVKQNFAHFAREFAGRVGI